MKTCWGWASKLVSVRLVTPKMPVPGPTDFTALSTCMRPLKVWLGMTSST